MRRTLISSCLLVSTSLICSPSSQLEVTAVRFWTLSEVTRVAVETNGEFHFRSDKLYNPDRVYFDLVGAKPRTGVRGIQVTNVGDKLLKRIRVAETQPGMTRVVLDLESAIEFKAEQLTNPDRLVIELRAAGSRPISSAKPEGDEQPVAASVILDKPVIEQKEPAISPLPARPPA